MDKVYALTRHKKGLISNKMLANQKIRRLVKADRFTALDCMYVLTALGRARIDPKAKGNSIVFNL